MCGSQNGTIFLPGKFYGTHTRICLDQDILSKHLMMLGGTGSGKTNVFYYLVSEIRKTMNQNDVMIVFDTKGDYYAHFGNKQDVVIGNSSNYVAISDKWNIFKEILSDGDSDDKIEINTNEISWSIFQEAIKSSKDPFFANAAREIFSAILLTVIKNGEQDKEYKKQFFYNSELKRAIDLSTLLDLKKMIEEYPSLSSVLSYIGDGDNGQALGVYAELVSSFRKIFTGVFAQKGGFSMRDFVRKKGGRTLFIEYDIAIGQVLTPVYSLLIDLALKEALGRSTSEGNVYIVCDEFRLLPHLTHLEDAVNFGRGLGIKILAGVQSINQLKAGYGEYVGKNIMAGFSSIFSFRPNDSFTREYVSNFFGKNIVVEQYDVLDGSLKEERKTAFVVEDWHLNELEIGEAVIGFPFHTPFKFRFDLF
jgi:type IV secretory pathway TraG/TraD family ATPase VirD4